MVEDPKFLRIWRQLVMTVHRKQYVSPGGFRNTKRISGRVVKLPCSTSNLITCPETPSSHFDRRRKHAPPRPSRFVCPSPTKMKRQNSGHEKNCPSRRTILYHVPKSSHFNARSITKPPPRQNLPPEKSRFYRNRKIILHQIGRASCRERV